MLNDHQTGKSTVRCLNRFQIFTFWILQLSKDVYKWMCKPSLRIVFLKVVYCPYMYFRSCSIPMMGKDNSLFLYKNYWSFCFRESFPETELVTLIWLCLQRILERKRDLRRMQNLKVNFSVVSLGFAFITQFCIPRNWFIQ